MFTKPELIDIYRRRAKFYDYSANMYYLIGFRETAFRKKLINAMNLKSGDTVVEVACGTGLNFPLIQKDIGPSGKIIGVDITDKMLEQAQLRIERHDWRNVELVKSDAADFEFPTKINGVLSAFAITLIPEYEQIIEKGSSALVSGGRFAILDFKEADNKPQWLAKSLALLMKPFGTTYDLAVRHPWEAIEKHLSPVSFDELYFGYAFISVGEAL